MEENSAIVAPLPEDLEEYCGADDDIDDYNFEEDYEPWMDDPNDMADKSFFLHPDTDKITKLGKVWGYMQLAVFTVLLPKTVDAVRWVIDAFCLSIY